MKQLKKLVLHKTTPLTAPQMKHITGGYEVNEYEAGTCAANFDQYEDNWICGINQTVARDLAAKYHNGTLGSLGSGYYCCDNCRPNINCLNS